MLYLVKFLIFIPFLFISTSTSNNVTKYVEKSITIRTLYTTEPAVTSTSTVLFTDTVDSTVTSVITAPAWTATHIATTLRHTVTEVLTSSATRTVTKDKQVSLLLRFQQTTTITIPTSTVGVTKTLNLEAETMTQNLTVSTVPVTTAASLLFCYNFI